MTSLDDARALKAVDKGNMFGVLDGYVDDFMDAFRTASGAQIKGPPNLEHIVVVGMGGSGIVGNVASDLLKGEGHYPVRIVKDYRVPEFVGPKSLVVAISYSGDTEETLQGATEAKTRGATIVAISSGGKLEKLARGPRTAHLPVKRGMLPRAALPHLFGTLWGAFSALKFTTGRPDAAFARDLRAFHATVKPDLPEERNLAKQFARDLHDKFPFWYASSPWSSVALRARAQLNENAKMLGRNDVLPEACHNEFVAWDNVPDGDRYFVGFIRQPREPREIALRFEFLADLLKRKGVRMREFRAPEMTPLGRLLSAFLFVDYVSVYAAVLRGVDPSPIPIITDLKQRLAEPRHETPIARRVR